MSNVYINRLIGQYLNKVIQRYSQKKMQEEPSSQSVNIPKEELNQFVQTHTLAEVYQNYLKTCSSQSQRVQQIRDSINRKIPTTQPYLLINQMHDLIKQEGSQLSKNQLVSHIQICNTIFLYQKSLHNKNIQENTLTQQNLNLSQSLLITILLDTIQIICFESQKSWISSTQMKFQFKCLLFDLLNQAFNFIQLLQNQQKQIKLNEFVQSFLEDNLIDKILTNSMHIEILKKSHNLFMFSFSHGILSEQRFFGLLRNYLKKSREEKRIVEQIFVSSLRIMNKSSLVRCLGFVQNQMLTLQNEFIQDSTVTCIRGLIDEIIKNGQEFLKDGDNERKVFQMVSEMKEMAEKVNDFEIKSSILNIYYEAVHRIFRSFEIKRQIASLFHDSMENIAECLQIFSTRKRQKIKRTDSKVVDIDQIEKQISLLVDNFIMFISSFQSLKQEQNLNQQISSIKGICQHLLNDLIINELILHCITSIHTYQINNKKNHHKRKQSFYLDQQTKSQYSEVQYKNKDQGIFNASIRKLLQLLKYILISSQCSENKIKQEIQKVFNIIQGKIQFLDWTMEFDISLQNQIFRSIFLHSQFGYFFKQITPQGFQRLYRKFLQLNYDNNKFLVVCFKESEGIKFFIKKSLEFNENIIFEGALIEVSEQQLIQDQRILQLISINLMMKSWLGMDFMKMLGWYTEYVQIKRKVLGLLGYSKYLDISTRGMVRNSQQNFVKQSLSQVFQAVETLESSNQQQVQLRNQQQINKKLQLIKGTMRSLSLMVKERSQQNWLQTSTFQSLSTINKTKATFNILIDIKIQQLFDWVQLYFKDINKDYFNILKFQSLFVNTINHDITVNSQSFIQDCINKVLCINYNKSFSNEFMNSSEYTSLIIENKSLLIGTCQPRVDRWSRLNLEEDKQNRFYVIDRLIVEFLISEQNPQWENNEDKGRNELKKIQISYYTASLLLKTIDKIGRNKKQLFQEIRNYWFSLKHFNVIEGYLQQFCEMIVKKQRNKFNLTNLIYENLKNENKYLYRVFLISLFQIISTLFQVRIPQQSVNSQKCIIRQTIQTEQNYEMLINLTQSSVFKNNKQCLMEINNLISLLPPCKQWMKLSIENLMKKILNSKSLKYKAYLLKITLHKLINSSQQRAQWKEKRHATVIIQIIQSIVYPNRVQKNYQKQFTKDLFNTLLQHLIVDLGSQPQISNLNQTLQNMLKVQYTTYDYIIQQAKQYTIMQFISSNYQKKPYTKSFVQAILHYKPFVKSMDQISINQFNNFNLCKSILIFVYQYLFISVSTLNFKYLLINILQKLNLNLQLLFIKSLPNKKLKNYQSKEQNQMEFKFFTIVNQLFQKILKSSQIFTQQNLKKLIKHVTMRIIFALTFYLPNQLKQNNVNRKKVLNLIRNQFFAGKKERKDQFCVGQKELKEYLLRCSSMQLKLINQYILRYGKGYNQMSTQQKRMNFLEQLVQLLYKQYLCLPSQSIECLILPLSHSPFRSLLIDIFKSLKCIFYSLPLEQVINLFGLGWQNIIFQLFIHRKKSKIQLYHQYKQQINLQQNQPQNQQKQLNDIYKLLTSQVRQQVYEWLVFLSSNFKTSLGEHYINNFFKPFIESLKHNNSLIKNYNPLKSINNNVIQATDHLIPQFKQFKVGLYNYGNTCYINSLVQLLYNITPFSQKLITYLSQQQQNSQKSLQQQSSTSPQQQQQSSTSPQQQQQSLTQTIKRLKQLFIVMKYSDAKFYSPYNFISSLQPHLNLGDQQDTTQFFHIIQNQLQKSNLNHLLKHIQGTTSTTIICQNCHKQKINIQPFLLYNLQIQNKSSLSNALIDMTKQQTIQDYKCSQCQQLTQVKKYTQINNTSQYFFIQLKRINYDYNLQKSVKIHKRFLFPKILDLNSISLQRQNNYLQLFGIIVHAGTGENGHYYSYVKQKDHKWICYNDTVISSHYKEDFIEKCYGSSDNGTDRSENAYILVYRKVSINHQQQPRQSKQQFLQYKSNTIIQKVKQQNQRRLQAYIINQYDPKTNKNLLVDFIDKIIQVEKNQQLLKMLSLYMQFSFSLIQINLPHIQFFLVKTKSLLQKYSSVLTKDFLLQYFPQNMLYLQNKLFTCQFNNNQLKDTFALNTFVIILTALLSRKNNQQQQSKVNPYFINSYLQFIVLITPCYLSQINEDRQTHIKLYNIMKLLNHVIKVTEKQHKKYLFDLILNQISFIDLLKNFLHMKFCDPKVDQQILEFISLILIPINKSMITMTDFNTTDVINYINKTDSKSKHKSLQENQSTINKKYANQLLSLIGNPTLFKDVLISDQFWTKTLTFLQNLPTQSVQKQNIFDVLQPIVYFGVTNSFELREKLVKYTDFKVEEFFREFKEQRCEIHELKKWIGLLKILLVNHVQDEIHSNLQDFGVSKGQNTIEYEWNSLMKVRILNTALNKELVTIAESLQIQLIKIGVQLFGLKKKNQKMQTQDQVMMKKQQKRQQKQQIQQDFSIIGVKQRDYISCLYNYLSLIFEVSEALLRNRQRNFQLYPFTLIETFPQLEEHFISIYTQSIQDSLSDEINQLKKVAYKYYEQKYKCPLMYLTKQFMNLIAEAQLKIYPLFMVDTPSSTQLSQKKIILNEMIQSKSRILSLKDSIILLFQQYIKNLPVNQFEDMRDLRRSRINSEIRFQNRYSQIVQLSRKEKRIKVWKGQLFIDKNINIENLRGVNCYSKLIQIKNSLFRPDRQFLQKLEMQFVVNNKQKNKFNQHFIQISINLNKQLINQILNYHLLLTLTYNIDVYHPMDYLFQYKVPTPSKQQKYILLSIQKLSQQVQVKIENKKKEYQPLRIQQNQGQITISCLFNKLIPLQCSLSNIIATISLLPQNHSTF